MRIQRARMDESILVCAYYGPNGERLIRRGSKIANMLDCPLYVLTIDSRPKADISAEKLGYLDTWEQLSDELGAEEFIVRDNEKRPVAEVIADVAQQLDITQIILGQSPQTRWEEIKKGCFVNSLLREISFVDLHVVALDRTVIDEDNLFDSGTRAYIVKVNDEYRISFVHSDDVLYEGIFYKETGTDFNNGVFKFARDNRTCQLHVTDEVITEPTRIHPSIKEESL